MKKILGLLVLIIFTTTISACSQNKNSVPDPVISSPVVEIHITTEVRKTIRSETLKKLNDCAEDIVMLI